MKEFFKRAGVVACGSLFMLALVAPLAAYAQSTEGLEVKPAIVEDKVNPGEVHQYSISVTNVTSVTKTFYVTVRDIQGLDSQGRPIFASTTEVTPYALSSWVNIPQGEITLAAGGTQTIPFSVQVPQNASPGSHFASVFFSDKPAQLQTSGSGVGVSVGAIVSLLISGNINEEAQLEEFSTDKLVYPTPDVTFNTKVQNLGNVLEQPTGTIQITDMFGKTVGNVDVNSAQASVFPGSDRTYTSNWNPGGFAFGRYEAVVSLSYGTEARQTIYSTTSFWVLPLVPIFSVLGSLLLIVIVIYGFMRAYIRRKLREMGVHNVSRADTDLYRKKYQQSGSRLVVVSMVVLLVCIAFLVMLFVLFA